MNPHYPFVANRANHRCEYCRAPEEVFNLFFEIEHIISLALGGLDNESNLALACRACNLFKLAFIIGFDQVTGTEVRLFHPRQDRWEEHFSANQETGFIQGLTDVGRATVQRLRMNQPHSVTARLQWIRFGLFP
jgi:hypothetical protein